MPCNRGYDGTGDRVVLTVEDVSLDDLVLMHPDGNYNLYPEWCVRGDAQMMESWAENPDMFITLRVALASRRIEAHGEQRMLTADGPAYLRGWYPMSSKLARLAVQVGVEDPYTPRVDNHTSYHMGVEPGYAFRVFDGIMLRAVRKAGAEAQRVGEDLTLTMPVLTEAMRFYQEEAAAPSTPYTDTI